MIYKQSQLFLSRKELQKNCIIPYTFILEVEDKSIIFGDIKLKDGSPAVGFGIVLEEIDKNTNLSIDKCFSFTNEEGKYYLIFKPVENKLYKIVAYRTIDIN